MIKQTALNLSEMDHAKFCADSKYCMVPVFNKHLLLLLFDLLNANL